ncbi:MAG: alpha/beta hydrolase family protein, partial [Planctomycetaceae bacterium]
VTAPRKFPRLPAGTLRPLLTNAQGRPIRTLEQWKQRRAQIRSDWMTFLGPMPQKRPAVKLKILRTDTLKTVTRQLVRYESEPGEFVEGYLLRPRGIKAGGKRAGIVALHQTTRDTFEQIAGVKGPDMQQIGLKLAKRGFVVFCPRCYLWRDVKTYRDAVARFRKRHPRTLGMHKMLYDAIRGVDVLASLSYVDAKRIGAVGHSLGAKEALYLAAFDERIKAAVASEGGTGFKSTNWDAPWYLGKGINDPGFKLNHHELLALIAPRPFLILAGEKGRGSADGDRTWPFLVAAQPVCKLYGKPVRLGMYNHRKGHSIPDEAFQRMAEWAETYLGGG